MHILPQTRALLEQCHMSGLQAWADLDTPDQWLPFCILP